jgi:hypothetical protein
MTTNDIAAHHAQTMIEKHGYIADRVHAELVKRGIRALVYVPGRRDNVYVPNDGDAVEDAAEQTSTTSTDYAEGRVGPSHGTFEWRNGEPTVVLASGLGRELLGPTAQLCARGALGDRSFPNPNLVPVFVRMPDGRVEEFAPGGTKRAERWATLAAEFGLQTHVSVHLDRECTHVVDTWETS